MKKGKKTFSFQNIDLRHIPINTKKKTFSFGVDRHEGRALKTARSGNIVLNLNSITKSVRFNFSFSYNYRKNLKYKPEVSVPGFHVSSGGSSGFGFGGKYSKTLYYDLTPKSKNFPKTLDITLKLIPEDKKYKGHWTYHFF